MFRPLFLIVPLVTLIASSPVLAQVLPNLSSFDRQRLTRDLTPTNSQDFLRQGQAQLEREIRWLEIRSTTKPETLLKIDPAAQPQNPPRSLQSNRSVQRDR